MSINQKPQTRRQCLRRLAWLTAGAGVWRSGPLVAASAQVAPSSASLAGPAGIAPGVIGERVFNRFMNRGTPAITPENDFVLEAYLGLHDALREVRMLRRVTDILYARNTPEPYQHPWQSQPFNCVPFSLFLRVRNPLYGGSFLAESAVCRNEVPRSFDGAVSYFGDRRMGRILVDHFQEYMVRMLRTAWLGNNDSYRVEGMRQYRIFRNALRNSNTGLWYHGRGWYEEPGKLVDVHWGRAQALVLRGLVESLQALAGGTADAVELQRDLNAFATALVKYQTPEGYWRQVVNDPRSYTETSATGLIAYYLAMALGRGYLPNTFRSPVLRAYDVLVAKRVFTDGRVYGACPKLEPQPVADYYIRSRPEKDEPYGFAAVIAACAGKLFLDGLGGPVGPW